jgi:hypothetical protein|tara:strand:- start:30941 stop:31882 length:942 start_codon:yes stop_codon:yes gene_type:complete
MEEIVRAILNSRTVSLEPSEKTFNIYGFKCLGIAEKLLDLDEMSDSSVYIWHVQSDILPISKNEIERWSIDAPGNRHWILSERKITEDVLVNLPDDFKVITWGPDKLSRWIGESVLRGDLIVKNPSNEQILVEDDIFEDINNSRQNETITLNPVIKLEDWLQTEPSGSLNSMPVFLLAKLWKISGTMIGPDSIKDGKKWTFIEDPWMKKVIPFSEEQIFLNSPNLRRIKTSEDNWLSLDQLKTNLKPMLDFRKKEESNDATELVKSTMLEWWRVDLSSLNFDFQYAQIPAWKLIFEDGEEKILHSHNGKTYDL